MNADADTFVLSPRAGWLSWLRRELAPFPGREPMTLRIVVAVVLVTVISMTLQIPETAVSAYMVFFITKENRALTTIAGIGLIVGATIAVALSLFLYRYTFDHPELRIPVMALMVFGGMYLSRVFMIGPLGFAIGFITALTQSVAESAPNAEVLVRGLLWLWVVIVFPVVVTVIVNQTLLPANPWALVAQGLVQRLDAVSSVLQRAINNYEVGGRKNAALLDLATRGSSALFKELKFAAMKDSEVKKRHAPLTAAIVASERVVAVAAALEMREPHPLSAAEWQGAKALLAKIAQVRVALPSRDFAALAKDAPSAPAMVLELRELQLATASFRDNLLARDAAAKSHSARVKRHLFVPDALTNPAHARFALKVTLAAMTCYILYTGVDWSGIHTAFITCCFIALENTGASIRKGSLRLVGCLLGGLLGFLSIMYLVPHMESIVSLALLTAAGSALAGWVAAGSERISYAGLQIALAFLMCIFQGFAPGTDFDIIRDRIVGIVLGIGVSSFVFLYLWPERASDRLRVRLTRTLRTLGRLTLIPSMRVSPAQEKRVAAELRSEITQDLGEIHRLFELAALEGHVRSQQAKSSVTQMEGLIEHAQVAYVTSVVRTGEQAWEEWSRLEASAQTADVSLRTATVEKLGHIADCLEGDRPIMSDDVAKAGKE